jgi:hypothetical protein
MSTVPGLSLWTVNVYVTDSRDGCAGAKVFVIEVSAHGTVEIAADALLSFGLISVPTGADTVAVLFNSAADG